MNTTIELLPKSTGPLPVFRYREAELLSHEAMARSRQRESQRWAREHSVARSLTAGRTWALLARFATRRADRARAGVDR